MPPRFLVEFWRSLPPRAATMIGHAASLLIGLLIALSLHYVLYRIGLPGKPFIYVVF